MNPINDTDHSDEATKARELERKLKQMEKAGISWKDRAAAASIFSIQKRAFRVRKPAMRAKHCG